MSLKSILKRVVYGNRADSELYVKHLKQIGVMVKEGTEFIDPRTTYIDETRPWMISIGKSCCITPGVTILTHDYGWSVIKAKYGDILGSVGKTIIGDNVYIGMHATILAGVQIGNRVVIGANSLVAGNLPDDVVVAGNPARIICSIDEYYEKRKKKQLNEAVLMVREYKNRYGLEPPKSIMREHFWLFEDDYESLIPEFKDVFALVNGTLETSLSEFTEHKKTFSNYEEFLLYCFPNLKSNQ